MAGRPLKGLKVVVTRTLEASEEMAGKLAAFGAEPVILPAIEIVPIYREMLDTALSSLDMFDLVAFTSANAARVVCDRLAGLGREPAELSNRSFVASIGNQTSAALQSRGVEIGLQAEEAHAESLVSALVRWGIKGKLAFLPTSRIARKTLADGLRQAGAGVVQVAVYDTVAPGSAPESALRAVQRGEADVVTFTSPSTVDNFVKLTGTRDLPAVCIGSTTAEAARSAGFRVVAVARDQSADGMIEALIAYRERSRARE